MPSSPSAAKMRRRTKPNPTPASGCSPHTIKSSSNSSAFPNNQGSTSTARAILATTASEWMLMLTLIFGGCCSNAFTLELATRQLPSSGTLITFAQFLVTTLSSLPYFLHFSPRFPFIGLEERKVPLYRWTVQVGFYLSTSLLNNLAFGFDVPMSVHIVFRSGGLVINMILGWAVQRRRYSALQISSVVLVTLGVVSSTLYSTHTSSATSTEANSSEYATGVLLLFSALVLTGFMGLWQERTFKLYGNQNWRESMFYSHLLSLPFFALRPSNLIRDIHDANGTTPWWFGFGPPTTTLPHTHRIGNLSLIHPPTLRKSITDSTTTRIFDLSPFIPLPSWTQSEGVGVWIPSFYPPLVLNVATQLLCINGVNRLTSRISSLSVTLVLVVRKALSLMVSVMLVQRSTGTLGLWCGAAAVLAGTIGYSMSKPVPTKDEQQHKNKV